MTDMKVFCVGAVFGDGTRQVHSREGGSRDVGWLMSREGRYM